MLFVFTWFKAAYYIAYAIVRKSPMTTISTLLIFMYMAKWWLGQQREYFESSAAKPAATGLAATATSITGSPKGPTTGSPKGPTTGSPKGPNSMTTILSDLQSKVALLTKQVAQNTSDLATINTSIAALKAAATAKK